MEFVIDYEFLRGAQGEVILKELSVAGENVRDISIQKLVPHCTSQLRRERSFQG
jgi:hypothetical protein